MHRVQYRQEWWCSAVLACLLAHLQQIRQWIQAEPDVGPTPGKATLHHSMEGIGK